MQKSRKLIISILIIILLLGFGYWLSFYIHPQPSQLFDSPDVYRGYLNSDTLASRVAAMIILAGHGDKPATQMLLNDYQKLTSNFWYSQKQMCLMQWSKGDINLLSPELIDRFIKDDNVEVAENAIGLIPLGKEQEHLPAVRYFLQKHNRFGWNVTDYLIRINDIPTLKKIHRQWQQAFPRYAWNIDWAKIYLTIRQSNPLTGFDLIEKEFPKDEQDYIKEDYLDLLIKRKFYNEIIDLWFRPAMDTTTRDIVKRAIGANWDKIPESQKTRLTATERNMFRIEYAWSFERIGGKISRELFLLLLEQPQGLISNTIFDRIEAGDKDLEQLLLKKAFTTKDPKQLYGIAFAFHYGLGDIPPELRQYIQDFTKNMVEPDNAQTKKELLRLVELPGIKIPTAIPYQETKIPWVLRHRKTSKVVLDIKKIFQGLESYYIDMASYPQRSSLLTTPVAYMEYTLPDICAVQGPYTYYMQDYQFYIIASPGPDGIWNISLKHYLLYRTLGGAGKPKSVPLDPIYVKCDSKGNYTFPTKFEPGCDIAYIMHDFYQ